MDRIKNDKKNVDVPLVTVDPSNAHVSIGHASVTVDIAGAAVTVNGTPIGSGSGDVVGPSSATGDHLVVFNGITGKLVKDGGVVPSVANLVTGPSSATDNHLAVFNGTTGKIVKDGGAVPAATSAPSGEIVFGTGTGVTSDPGFTWNPTSGGYEPYVTLEAGLTVEPTVSVVSEVAAGIVGGPFVADGATVNGIVGLGASPYIGAGSTVTDAMIGVDVFPQTDTGGTTPLAIGVRVQDMTTALTGGVINKAIQTGLGLVSLGDNVVVSGTITATDFIMSGSSLKTDTTNGHTGTLQAYDVDGAAYKTFATLTNGNTPSLAIAPPSGGTVTVDATEFKVGGVAGTDLDIVVPTVGTLHFVKGIFTGLT